MGVRSLRASSNSSVSAGLAVFLGRPRLDRPLCLDDVASQLEQRLQELDADQQSLLVLPSQVFQPFAEGTKARIVQVSAEPLGDSDLDLLRPLLRVCRAEHGVEHVGVEHQRLQVIAHRLDVNVPVDEVDGLGAERVPEELARSGRGLQRLVHLAQPCVVGFVRLETRVGGDRVPEAGEVAVVGGECVACLVVREALLRGDQSPRSR